MRTLSALILLLTLTSFSNNKNHIDTGYSQESTVLICTGKYAKRYHNSFCRGMNACKGEQKKISLSDAKK